MRQASAYVGVGSVATLFHYIALVALVETGMLSVVPASAIGALAGAFTGYQLNYRFAFRSDAPHRETAPRYLIIAAIALGLNTALMAALIQTPHLSYLVAQAITTGLVFFLTFLGNKLWTFRIREEDQNNDRREGLSE